MEQGTDEWLELRKKHIGASDISCINGTNPWKSQYVLWKEKTGLKDPDKDNAAMKHGRDTEEIARETYMKEKGILIIPCIVFYDKWDIAMASLDGISQDKKTICEIKCPSKETLYDKALKKEIPPYYYDQIQWQLMISEVERCDYMVYLNEFSYTIIEVKSDKDYQEKLLNKAVKFWDHIRNNTPPPKGKEDPTYIESIMDNELASSWREYKIMEDLAVKERKIIEEQLKEKYKNEKSCFFPKAQIQMTKISKKGTIDWYKICEDFDISEIEIEKYRKESSSYSILKYIC